MHKVSSMPMAIGIMFMISYVVVLKIGIKPMVKVERAICSGKMMMMGDNSVQHQQHISWKQTRDNDLISAHRV